MKRALFKCKFFIDFSCILFDKFFNPNNQLKLFVSMFKYNYNSKSLKSITMINIKNNNLIVDNTVVKKDEEKVCQAHYSDEHCL